MSHAAAPARGDLVERIDAMLPQTQCTKCGYAGCRPYAEAIARGEANINRCPPGGAAGIHALAALLDREYAALDPECGTESPLRVAVIDEPRCIGCTLCIQACPVDAIVGASKRMHTVVAELCTGCDLCVAPCPVDCIAMVPLTGADAAWERARADAARARFEWRNARLMRDRAGKPSRLARLGTPSAAKKHAVVQAAVARARAKKAAAQRKR